jgi:hypothetical protein
MADGYVLAIPGSGRNAGSKPFALREKTLLRNHRQNTTRCRRIFPSILPPLLRAQVVNKFAIEKGRVATSPKIDFLFCPARSAFAAATTGQHYDRDDYKHHDEPAPFETEN